MSSFQWFHLNDLVLDRLADIPLFLYPSVDNIVNQTRHRYNEIQLLKMVRLVEYIKYQKMQQQSIVEIKGTVTFDVEI